MGREEVKKMKKMFSAGLVVVFACSFLLVGRGRADAMDNASAAILAGTMAIIGGAAISAIISDTHHPYRVYEERRPVVYHRVPAAMGYEYHRYKSYDRPYQRAFRHAGERFVYERGR